jgi:Metallo-beta-lactamase superfamily
MPNQLLAIHEFFPIGQGLFASGAVGPLSEPEPGCRWVYDCGTVSSQVLIEKALRRLANDASPFSRRKSKPKLDLVVVSHFDTDHVSGLASLLKLFRVDTLMLPFTHLDQRLRVMYSARGYTRISAQQFFIDPVGTLSAMEGADIGQIVMVPASGPEAAKPLDTVIAGQVKALTQPLDSDPSRATLTIEDGQPEDADEQGEFDLARAGALQYGIPVRFMCRDSSATYLDQWEFVPFNEPTRASVADAKFLTAVKSARAQLLADGNVSVRTRALAALKKLYDCRFGVSSKARNIISLLLYCGPTHERSVFTCLGNARMAEDTMSCGWNCGICFRARFQTNRLDHLKGQTGFLYSGDGYLETPGRWCALHRFYGAGRVGHLVGFQVMHHGSVKNWHKGIAKTICPGISVFSSDPCRGNTPHPHPKVKKDFAPHRLVQADKNRGVQIFTVYG